MKKYIIWSNRDLKLEDWKDCLEDWKPEITDENEQWMLVNMWNNEYLEDERANLNIDLHAGILAIADLGLWNGRKLGYKEMGTNIRNCLSGTCGDYVTWYVDELGDLRCEDCHHDGTNYYTYRAWKEGVSPIQMENLEWKIYCGKATRKDITRLTRKLGPNVAKVYGWEVRA
jgi:hypothetical protein